MFLNPFSWGYQVWRAFFVVAALWNFLSIFGIIWPHETLERATGKKIDDEIAILLYKTVCSSILLLGIGYLIIAFDPAANLGLVLLGIMGKIIAGVSFIYQYKTGIFKRPALNGAVGDLIFCLFFLLYFIGGVRGA